MGEYEGLVGEYFGDVGLPRGNSRVREDSKATTKIAPTVCLDFGT